MTNELIEAMALALWPYRQCDFANPGFRADREGVYRQARAALAAAEAEGYRLVPVEITEPMLDVMHDRIRILCDPERRTANIRNDREVWAAMLAAAPDHVADASKKEVGRADS